MIEPRYQSDQVTLYCGDCKDVLPYLKNVDVVLTDPPYGVDYKYSTYSDTRNNLKISIDEVKKYGLMNAERMAIFTGVANNDIYSDSNWTYAWVCPAGTGVSAYGFTCWTPIAFYGKDVYSGKGSRPDVFVDYKPKRTGADHPAEKPLSVMRWSIERFSKKNDLILDPFMGSGTTGVACVQLGRRFIGIEIDEKYYQIAEKRIREAEMQLRLPL